MQNNFLGRHQRFLTSVLVLLRQHGIEFDDSVVTEHLQVEQVLQASEAPLLSEDARTLFERFSALLRRDPDAPLDSRELYFLSCVFSFGFYRGCMFQCTLICVYR